MEGKRGGCLNSLMSINLIWIFWSSKEPAVNLIDELSVGFFFSCSKKATKSMKETQWNLWSSSQSNCFKLHKGLLTAGFKALITKDFLCQTTRNVKNSQYVPSSVTRIQTRVQKKHEAKKALANMTPQAVKMTQVDRDGWHWALAWELQVKKQESRSLQGPMNDWFLLFKTRVWSQLSLCCVFLISVSVHLLYVKISIRVCFWRS